MSAESPDVMPPMPLPTPPDFPIAWDPPSDAAQMWFYNKTLYRDPVTPLDFSLRIRLMHQGINRGNVIYGMPFNIRERLINSYVFVNNLPTASIDADTMATLMKAAEIKVRIEIEKLADTWQHTWFPHIQADLAFWESYDLTPADLPALLAHLADAQRRLIALWEIHNMLLVPSFLVISTLDDFYRAILPDAPDGEAYNLLIGFDNKTTESGRALWQLSRQALNTAEVVETLLSTEPAAVPAQLATTAAGRAFWQQVVNYLQQYGKRNELMYLHLPSWCEAPAPVIKNLQNYLRQSYSDPEREREGLIAEREALLAAFQQRLAAVAPERMAEFAEIYEISKTAIVLSEDHNFWLDYQSYYYSRQIALAIGQRLVSLGILDTVDNIFYLTLDELHALTQIEAGHNYRNLVQERQRAAQPFATVTPPMVIGTLAPFPPMNDPLSLAGFKFAGMPFQAPQTPHELRGNPASAGIVRGKAKVAITLNDINKIEPGDILVAPVTTSSWTPLFASVAAVITETGGILSHAAVVAREYHLPAVVGVQGATTLLSDGQWLEVDGAAGIVRVLASV